MNDPDFNRKTLAAFDRLEDLRPARPSECMKVIKRRIDFLRKTIEGRTASAGALDFYRAEFYALRWASEKLTAVLEAERAARASAEELKREAA